jgi:predicted ribosomally synthesized peptide with SipW-like signal peptide
MNIRKIAMLGVSGAAGLGLIGVGSHAAFTQNTTSDQQITAGTMKVVVSKGPATPSSGPTLTLAPVGPTGSSFTTGDQTVTITNQSDIAVNEITSTPSDNVLPGAANQALDSEAFLCEVSSGQVIYNGPLHSAPAQAIAGTLAAGATDSYTVNVYAGTEPTACGAVTTVGGTAAAGTSAAPSLNNDAQGGVIDPTLTVSYTA